MTNKPLIMIVGADKGGVGKTTITKVLLDYLQSLNIPYKGWDTENESDIGVLHRFFPQTTEVVDLAVSAGQMKVLDTLSTDRITVVDAKAGLLTPTLKMLADTGLLNMVQTGTINLAVVHVIGPTFTSLREIDTTSSIIGGASHFLVKNHINKSTFFEWDPAVYGKSFADIKNGLIEIKNLDQLAAEHVEQSGLPFSEFGKAPNQSLILRGYVNHWMKGNFEQFNKANLKELVHSGIQ